MSNKINRICKETGAAILRFGEIVDGFGGPVYARFKIVDPLCRELAEALAQATGLTVSLAIAGGDAVFTSKRGLRLHYVDQEGRHLVQQSDFGPPTE